MAWKILLAVIIVGALGYAGYSKFGGSTIDKSVKVAEEKSGETTAVEETMEKKEPATGAPLGNTIDEVAAVAAADADTDASLFAEEAGDASLLDEDGQAVGDYGGTYNESEF